MVKRNKSLAMQVSDFFKSASLESITQPENICKVLVANIVTGMLLSRKDLPVVSCGGSNHRQGLIPVLGHYFFWRDAIQYRI